MVVGELRLCWQGGRELTRLPDTNVLIKHLALLRSLVTLLAASEQEGRPTLLIPHIVLSELDGLKNSTHLADTSTRPSSFSQHSSHRLAQASIGSLARAASAWLLSALPGTTGASKEVPVVRGQRLKETLILKNDRLYVGDNDTRVLDACLFFRDCEPRTRVILLSDDKNLCLRARFEEVLAMSLGDVEDPRTLLERLDPTLAPAFNPRTSSPIASLPPSSSQTHQLSDPTTSIQNSARDPPQWQASWNHDRPLAPPFATSRPQPQPTHSNPGCGTSMELDKPLPPSSSPSPPPDLFPIHDPSDVYRNLSLLIPHFLALPLFRHIFLHLQQAPSSSQSWREEPGEYSCWDAATCVRIARRWWTDGDVRGACLRGFERAVVDGGRSRKSSTSGSSSARADQTTTPSRWAQGSERVQSTREEKPAATKRVESLYRSLPALADTLATPAQTTTSWSAPRFEVLLESVSELLCAVLAGTLIGEGVERDVKAVVKGWAEDLGGVGVEIDPTTFP